MKIKRAFKTELDLNQVQATQCLRRTGRRDLPTQLEEALPPPAEAGDFRAENL